MFEENEHEKLLKLGTELLSLNIKFELFDEYDDNYCEIEYYGLVDTFYFFNNYEYSNKIKQIKDLYFSIIIQEEYEYERLISSLNTINYYELNNFNEVLDYVSNKSRCLKNIKSLLEDDLDKKNIKFELLLLMLKYVNDEKLFRTYAYNYEPISLPIFNMYYDYMKKENKDTKKIIVDVLKLFPTDINIENYAKAAVELDDSNEEYKIMLYNSNPKNISNFFELYKIKDKNKMLKLLKSDFHLSLSTLDLKYINNLDTDKLLQLIELLSNKYSCNTFDDRTLSNIKLWQNSFTINSNYLNNLCNYALEKLNEECKLILGNKNRDYYSILANHTYRLDQFKKRNSL